MVLVGVILAASRLRSVMPNLKDEDQMSEEWMAGDRWTHLKRQEMDDD